MLAKRPRSQGKANVENYYFCPTTHVTASFFGEAMIFSDNQNSINDCKRVALPIIFFTENVYNQI